MTLAKRSITEAIGTFWLIFAGCGSAVLACGYPQYGIGFVGVSLAFGLTVLCLAYAIGHVSGCHLNPAVTIGLATGGRFAWKDVPAYIGAQVVGAILGAGMLLKIAHSHAGFDLHGGGFAANGYGAHSPGGYSMHSGFAAEMMLTWLFVMIILGATDTRAPKGFAPIAIGLGLALTNLVGIPVTNAAINPARATGPAFYVHGWALQQLWLFWAAPILGAVLGALTYNYVAKEPGITASVPSTMKS
ncbi:MAG TPA: aquaporin Z [Acidobacteriaceae bacterium]|nr:aquaporin Z [Acidobacteriaceae bacterium]